MFKPTLSLAKIASLYQNERRNATVNMEIPDAYLQKEIETSIGNNILAPQRQAIKTNNK